MDGTGLGRALIFTAAMATAGAALAMDFKDFLKGMLESGKAPASTGEASVGGAQVLATEEIVRGLKEALAKGAQSAVADLGRDGGFLNNAAVKIPMPPSLGRVESALRALGQDRYADQFVTTINQAAEKAVPEAAGILADAIRDMSLDDARAILHGGDDAATQYFRAKSETRLMERFKPIVTQATDQVGVTSAYKSMVKRAGPWVGILGANDEDLDSYVTRKSLDGLFKMVADEEKAIRSDPVARSTDLLKKVFGGLHK